MNVAPLILLFCFSLSLVLGKEKCRITERNTILCRNATKTDLPSCLEIDRLIFYESTVERLTQSFFKDFQKITEFRASGDRIDRIDPGTFEDLYSLRWIDISSNNLKEINANLLTYLHIKYFDASENQLVIPQNGPFLRNDCKVLRDSYGQCGFIEWLKLESNDIKELYPETFKEVADLKRLSLARNLLKTLPELIFAENKKLRYLDLSGNKMKTLSHEIFTSKGMRTLLIRLEGNPWVCDYKMTDFIEKLRHNVIDNVACHKPRGLKWRDITDPAQLKAEVIDETEL